MPKRNRTKLQSKDTRKAICLRVKQETASRLAELAVETNSSQGRVIDSFLKPFLEVN